MPLSRQQGLSPAAESLGLGGGLGSALADQVIEQTDEERKKRLMRQEQLRLMGPAAMALGLSGNGALGV